MYNINKYQTYINPRLTTPNNCGLRLPVKMAPSEVENEITLCEKCNKNVTDGENGLLCDGFCRSWFHTGCVNINVKNYRKICDLGDKVMWLCTACICRMDSMRSYAHDVNNYFNLHDLMGSLSKIVKGLSSDNLQIKSRLDTVILHNSKVGGYVKKVQPDTSYERDLASAPPVSWRVKDHEMESIGKYNSDQLIESEDQTDENRIRLNKSEERTPTATIEKAISPKRIENEERSQTQENRSSSSVLLDDVASVVTISALPTLNISPRVIKQAEVLQTVAGEESDKTRLDEIANTGEVAVVKKSAWIAQSNKRDKKSQSQEPKPVAKAKGKEAHIHPQGNNVSTKGKYSISGNSSKENQNLHRPSKPATFSEVLNRPKPTQSSKKSDKPRQSVVGSRISEDDSGLVGVKKAWLHLGKLKKGTTTEDVESFVVRTFPGVSFEIEKLASKGMSCSFKLGMDFDHKEAVLESAKWPKYVTLRRYFLAKRPVGNQIR